MLRTRVVTALVAAPLGIAAVIWLPPSGFQVLIALMFGLAAREWCQFCDLTAALPRALIGAAVAIAFYALLVVVPSQSQLAAAALIGATIWLLGALWLRFSDFGRDADALARAAKALFGLATFIAGAAALAQLTGEGVGRYLLVLLLLLIWGADVGAYFTGMALGKHKLAPRISPGKTWEGVWGGQVVVVVVAVTAGFLLELEPARHVGLVLAGMLTAAVSVVGDLMVSLMKRHVGLKDAGRLFPGHGGVLDRFDSLIAASPIFVACLQPLAL